MSMLAQLRWIVVATLLGSLAGFLASYLLPAEYAARASIGEFPPRHYDYWGPRNESESEKLASYLKQAFSLNNLRPLIEREGTTKPDEVENVYEEIRKNTKLQPASADNAASYGQVIVDVTYRDSAPSRAERLCSALTSVMLEKWRAEQKVDSDGAILFLQRVATEAKDHLQELHTKLLKCPLDHKLALEYARERESYADLTSKMEEANRAQLLIRGEAPPHGFEGLGMLLPCGTSTIPDFPNRVHCAAIGSALGLSIGIALNAARRKSFSHFAEPRR